MTLKVFADGIFWPNIDCPCCMNVTIVNVGKTFRLFIVKINSVILSLTALKFILFKVQCCVANLFSFYKKFSVIHGDS